MSDAPSSSPGSATGPIVLCADGSGHSNHALAAGLELVGRAGPFVVVTVVHEPDPMLVTGTGIAGGVMSSEAFEEQIRANTAEGTDVASSVAGHLGLSDPAIRVVLGDPGSQICDLAVEVGARAIVLGSRGRGGLKRAILGSVSDHVVRHAPCPVIITGPAADDDFEG